MDFIEPGVSLCRYAHAAGAAQTEDRQALGVATEGAGLHDQRVEARRRDARGGDGDDGGGSVNATAAAGDADRI